MFRTRVCAGICLLLIGCVFSVQGQQPATAGNAIVPPMVKFSGTLTDANGKSLSEIVGVTFLLYKDSQGGAPLWMETQNVQPDKNGRYTVMLGSASSQGLPPDLFISGEARWLGVQAQGQPEPPRTMLMSVPYALKAADAETLGGKPLSAFQLAAPQPNNSGMQKAAQPAEQANEIRCAGGAACKTTFIPVFSTNGGSAKVGDSIISQSGTNIAIAGSATASGNITAGGNLGVSGNLSATIATVANPAGTAITGSTAAPAGAVVGINTGSSAVADGVDGVTSSASASGVAGINNSGGIGLYGVGGTGVYGTGTISGVEGQGGSSANSFGGYFLGWSAPAGSGSSGGVAVEALGGNGDPNIPDYGGIGVYSIGGGGTFADGLGGFLVGGCCSANGDGVFGVAGTGYAGNFDGNVNVSGSLSKGGGSFKIDHPLDPANKYLYHSFVESPDMMNIYNGTVALDASGEAVISMPEWFGVLNRDFRYQLTCIGGFAPVYIAEKLAKQSIQDRRWPRRAGGLLADYRHSPGRMG